MKIQAQKVFNFVFPYLSNMEMGFAVVADTQEDAAHQLQKWMTSCIAELSMVFPTQAPIVGQATPSTAPPTELNDLQRGHLSRLIQEMSKWRQPEPTLEETVKKWVDVDLTQVNFIGAMQLLEQLKNQLSADIQIIDSTDAHSETVQGLPSAEVADDKRKKK